MPLHDTVGINSEKRTDTENQITGAKYMGLVVYVGYFSLRNLTWHDYLSVMAEGPPILGGRTPYSWTPENYMDANFLKINFDIFSA